MPAFVLIAAPTSYNLIGGLSHSDMQVDAQSRVVVLQGQSVTMKVVVSPTAPSHFRVQ